jgi:hypothetical protein
MTSNARTDDVTIRRATAADAPALRALAQLDSAPVPAHPVFVAEVGGRLRAAVSQATGEAVADPFFLTHHLVALLRVAAEQATEDRVRARRTGLRTVLAAARSPLASVRAP